MLSSQTDVNVFVLIIHYHLFLSVTSGVLPGSVLEPLLFLIFINSLTVACHPKHAVSGMFLYADDAKLFSADSNDLQQSLIWCHFVDGILSVVTCPSKMSASTYHSPPDADKASNQYDIGNQNISSLCSV